MNDTVKQLKKDMASDLKQEYGALVSVSDVARYTGLSKRLIGSLLFQSCIPVGEGTGRRYFYKDAVAAICERS